MPDINAGVAEWLIARFTERSRAASIVGDLLEVTAKQGSHAFWLSIAGVVLALTWRQLTAFAAALLCLYLNEALGMAFRGPLHGVPLHNFPNAWTPFFAFLALVVGCLWMAAPYALICYGLRDRFAQLAVALCIALTVVFFFWFVPAAVLVSAVVALLVVIVCASFPQGRRALLALVLIVATGYVGLHLTVYLLERFVELAPPSVPLTVAVQHSIALIWTLAVTITCAWTHQLLLSRTEQSSDTPSSNSKPVI
jgi:hypothetical protein